MPKLTKVFAAFAVWGTATAPSAIAQDTTPVGSACPAGATVVGNLGFERLNCRNCTYYMDEEQPINRRWQFNTEPVIMGVRRGGPADGKLEKDDVIVAIDGALITSAEGGQHFGRLEPGEPIDLTVRRGGREISVEITPAPGCGRIPNVAWRPFVPPPDSAVPRILVTGPRPSFAPPALPMELPRAWFGFSIRCSNCGISIEDAADQVWHFSSPPTIENVESESPADRAGIRVGDRITSINGLDITTTEGGAHFGRVVPGDTATLGIQRGDAGMTVPIAAGMRERPSPAPRPGGIVQVSPQPDVPRFSGVIGDALVEVTGGPIMVQRTVNEIVIRSGDITVRIKRTEP